MVVHALAAGQFDAGLLRFRLGEPGRRYLARLEQLVEQPGAVVRQKLWDTRRQVLLLAFFFTALAVVGGAIVKKPKLLTPYPPDTGTLPVAYPPPFFMPKVGCTRDAELSIDKHTLNPGSWNDPIFPPKGVTSLNPGVYCINGDFILGANSELEGNGVVLKVEHGRVQFASSATYQFHAPTSGKYAGLLLYLPMENHSKVQLNGSADATLAGAILHPEAGALAERHPSLLGLRGVVVQRVSHHPHHVVEFHSPAVPDSGVQVSTVMRPSASVGYREAERLRQVGAGARPVAAARPRAGCASAGRSC